jgi:hypothetical protein
MVMKKGILRTFSALAIMSVIAVSVSSCGSKKADVKDKTVMMPVDTTGLAAFQAHKAQENQNAVASTYKPVKTTATKSSSGTKAAKTQSGSMSTSNQYPAKAKPKGWSKAAKGAVIGAGSGAVIGAVINKRNRAIGAAIGGVAGGAVGYGIGRHMDKKDGRY